MHLVRNPELSKIIYSIQIPNPTDICVKPTGGNYQYRGCFCCGLFSPIASHSHSSLLSQVVLLSLKPFRDECTEAKPLKLKLQLQLIEKSLPLAGIEPGSSLSTREYAIH